MSATAPRRLILALALPAVLSMAACSSGISLDEPIEGPTWRLVQVQGETVDGGADPQGAPSMQFGSDGRAVGSGGCNRFSGTYSRTASQLRIGQLAATRMACAAPERGQREMQFFQALQATASYRLQGPAQLVLLDGNGRTVALLQR
ncbi:META domain-containing protein [uncultured Pseudacidovorax sp.]|uniref:META domain-containing protein n=1 Tax=uncultured Pseudacidovorax sp. TaxID=679313 RepID=UPI0025D05A03|nr:META domain-containing protein [uncultured Pseudacidovorax sp.]